MASGPTFTERVFSFPKEIEQELCVAHTYKSTPKDILIVTHDQFDYLRQCVQSIRDNTEDYQIYVWDNGSTEEMRFWLASQPDVIVTRSETNLGFIIPNNRLISQGKSPFVILLNDDTLVYPGWDKALIAHLQNTKASQVGYIGGWLGKDAKGSKFGWGGSVDYIPGWCFAISRQTYQEFGLFDETLVFAYCEDADFSMRLTAAGKEIYALHLGLVHHFENQTIKNVVDLHDCYASFASNHAVLKTRWGDRFAASC